MTNNEIVKLLRRGMFSDLLLNIAADAIEELENDNHRLRAQLTPFMEKQCFTCSFYSIGDDHMPCYNCRDYDKYKWLGDVD